MQAAQNSPLYRPAEAADAAALAAFANASFVATFGHLYPPEDLAVFLAESYDAAIQHAEILDPETDHLLAWRGETLCGFAKLGREKLGQALPGRPALELHRLYVAEAEKGQGTAHELLRWAIGRARARGARDLLLSVFSENHRARRFYAKYGFQDVAPYIFRVGSIEDADLICRLDLAE